MAGPRHICSFACRHSYTCDTNSVHSFKRLTPLPSHWSKSGSVCLRSRTQAEEADCNLTTPAQTSCTERSARDERKHSSCTRVRTRSLVGKAPKATRRECAHRYAKPFLHVSKYPIPALPRNPRNAASTTPFTTTTTNSYTRWHRVSPVCLPRSAQQRYQHSTTAPPSLRRCDRGSCSRRCVGEAVHPERPEQASQASASCRIPRPL